MFKILKAYNGIFHSLVDVLILDTFCCRVTLRKPFIWKAYSWCLYRRTTYVYLGCPMCSFLLEKINNKH